jgi:CRP/FNR family transcriptional regulator
MGRENGAMRQLWDGLPAVQVPAQAEVFRGGDYGSCMYAIRHGAVDVLRGGTVVERLGPGDVFGETALFGQFRRSATARTTEATELVAVDRARLVAQVRQHPHVVLELLELLARRLHQGAALDTGPGQ